MKNFRKSWLAALSLSVMLAVSPVAAFACGDSGDLNKSQLVTGDNTFQEVPLVQGGKNWRHLQEAAAVEPLRLKGEPVTTADVFAYKGYAYLGTHLGRLTNEGVRIFDMKDPEHPVEVAVIGNDLPGTWQEKVIVTGVSTPHFHGDLLAFSVQKFSRTRDGYTGEQIETGGVVLYDVTNPRQPKKLGFWKTPKELPTGTHEFAITEQGSRVLLLATNYTAHRYRDQGVTVHDFSIVDITDPRNPRELANWDPTAIPGFDGSYRYQDENGATRTAFLHSVIADETGKYAYLSYWDLGTVILDISDPEHPKYLGRTKFERNVQGAAHSAALAHGGNILIETREVFNPDPHDPALERGWGYVRIYDIKDKTNPVLLSTFRTTNSVTQIKAGQRLPGAYTVHDPKVRGNTLYLSHYSDGIRIVDITDPAHPVEVGSYVTPDAFVWGVFVERDYLLASDMGQGLKVLKKSGND